MMKLDLHIHSTASDGTYSPGKIAKESSNRGLSFFSITDHDTVAAYDAPFPNDTAGTLIPGVELSAEFSGGTLHILGYGIDPFEENLRKNLEELQSFRLERNKKMIEGMEELGFDISLEELLNEAGGELVGRPHFSALMLKKGYVETRQEAFDKYLKKGAPLYIDKKRLLPEDAIALIKGAGGLAVFAHPFQTNLLGNDLRELAGDLASKGLSGVEAFYSSHTEKEIGFCLEIAKDLGLLVTAGSDFHGDIKPDIPLGMIAPSKLLKPFIESVGCRLPGGLS